MAPITEGLARIFLYEASIFFDKFPKLPYTSYSDILVFREIWTDAILGMSVLCMCVSGSDWLFEMVANLKHPLYRPAGAALDFDF